MRGRPIAVAALTVAALVAVLAGGALARSGQRPDLTVSAGSVAVAGGQLKGSFVVRNKGDRPSGRFSAALDLRTAGKKKWSQVQRVRLRSLGDSASRTVKFAAVLPGGLPTVSLPVRVCVDDRDKVAEVSERNNCRGLGRVQIAPVATPPAKATPISSVPTDPIPFTEDTVFTLNSAQGTYWIYVPKTYDASHMTPTPLLVWLHGCGGESSGDIYDVSPGEDQDWISIAPGGREGECWNPGSDGPLVMAAIADVKTHFNVDPHRVILGGYSSGGDLAYRLAFYNANSFAGVLAENTSPFRDTGSTAAESLAAAAWKFNVVHLAHLQDTTYPIAGVQQETNEMKAAGFPLTFIAVKGTHYDEPGEMVAGEAVPGTVADLRTYLLPHIDDGWRSP